MAMSVSVFVAECSLCCATLPAQSVFGLVLQSAKAEKTIPLKDVKCYLGLKKRLKPPTK